MERKHTRGLRSTVGELSVSFEERDVGEVIGIESHGAGQPASVRSRRVLPSSGFDDIFNILIPATRIAPWCFVNLIQSSNPASDTRGILSAQAMFGARL